MEKRKSHNQMKEIIFGALGVLGVIVNILGVYYTHLLGIGFGFYVVYMIRIDKENRLESSTLGKILGWISLLMGFGVIIYGSMNNLQGSIMSFYSQI